MGNTVKLLILVIVCEVFISALVESDVMRNRNLREGREETRDGGYQRRYRYRRNGMGKWKAAHLRSHDYNRSDSYKKLFRQWPEEQRRREVSSEEEYYRKASRDALIGKGSDKARRKIANFDAFNMKILHNGEHDEEKRSANGYRWRNKDNIAQRTHPPEEMDDFTLPNRQKKLKKHGGFIPLPTPKERKPNIILILTDDQDVELGSLNFMPRTLRLLRDGGAEFRHAYVTTPMCCPSRSSLLTGMYVHNHNVFTNNENCSNIQWQQTHETRTFATYLSNAGYRTGYFGKYLNKYNGSYIPPGWREWGGLIMNSRYYNYSINMNGKKIKHGWDYHKDYYTDLIANDSVAFLRQSKQYFSRKPVMLVVSFPAPHGPEDSAPQFHDMFLNVTTHHTPSYDFAPNPDKQWILQVTNKMQNIHKQFTDMLMTKRLQTLQSVDVAVERIYQELKNIGELDNTYIIYTSDHGYHLGQFGLVKGKSFPFEFDVRVPFLVRGPGVEPGTLVEDIVLNIDLAPTFLDIAGVESPLHMDGRSIVRLLHSRQSKRRKVKWPDTFLIESPGRRENPAELDADGRKIRPNRNKYKNLFWISKEKPTTTVAPSDDMSIDMAEMDSYGTTEVNEMRSKSYGTSDFGESVESDVEEEFNEDEENDEVEEKGSSHFQNMPVLTDTDTQVDNKISALNQAFSHAIPKSARLAIECRRPDMQSPCQPGQKWHCVADGGRWRKHKCKFQRNCICATPKGFLYAKLESYEKTAHRHFYGKTDKRYLDGYRNRRNADLTVWGTIPSTVDYSTLVSLINRSRNLKQRRKRESAHDDITAIVDDLEQELSEAEETETILNTTIFLGEEPTLSRCSVTSLGQVNCSSIVYSDFAVWKQSRDQVEARIKNLKMELEALKEIRKHLRERKPSSHSFPTLVLYNGTMNSSDIDDDRTNYTDPAITESYMYEYTSEGLFTAETTDETSNVSDDLDSLETTTFSAIRTTPSSKWRSNKNKGNEDGSVNRIDGPLTDINRGRDKCVCALEGQDLLQKNEAKELAREARRRMKEERLRKKERKMKKKGKMEKECLSEKMNCFNHDNEHWRTPPLWTEGPFCFCMNANNNSYSCLRTINSTHNFLYCEFTTGFRTYYNLRLDPFEQLNRISTLTLEETNLLSSQLAELKACRGARQCGLGVATVSTRSNREMLY